MAKGQDREMEVHLKFLQVKRLYYLKVDCGKVKDGYCKPQNNHYKTKQRGIVNKPREKTKKKKS